MACVLEDLKCCGAWDTTGGHKAKDITPVDRLEERGVDKRFIEKMREGHCQSDKHWSCFKGNIEETSERWGGAHNYRLF